MPSGRGELFPAACFWATVRSISYTCSAPGDSERPRRLMRPTVRVTSGSGDLCAASTTAAPLLLPGGIASPIAGVTTEIDDQSRLLADLDFARACGFGAKLCIHPKQVDAIHAAMRPSEAEIAWAKRVAAAAQSGQGAVQLDGKMVDRPVIAKAMRILARA